MESNKPTEQMIVEYTSLESYTLNSIQSRREAKSVYAYIAEHPELGIPKYIQTGRKTFKREE